MVIVVHLTTTSTHAWAISILDRCRPTVDERVTPTRDKAIATYFFKIKSTIALLFLCGSVRSLRVDERDDDDWFKCKIRSSVFLLLCAFFPKHTHTYALKRAHARSFAQNKEWERQLIEKRHAHKRSREFQTALPQQQQQNTKTILIKGTGWDCEYKEHQKFESNLRVESEIDRGGSDECRYHSSTSTVCRDRENSNISLARILLVTLVSVCALC